MSGGNKNGWSRSTRRYPFAMNRPSQTITNTAERRAGPGQPILQQPEETRGWRNHDKRLGLGRWRKPSAVAEAVPEPAEHAAFGGQGLAGRGGFRALVADGLVVVGPRDGVDHLLFGEVLRALDLGDKADQIPVLHNLGFEPGRAVGVPFRLAAVGQGHPDPELIGADFGEVRVDAAGAKGVGNPAG